MAQFRPGWHLIKRYQAKLLSELRPLHFAVSTFGDLLNDHEVARDLKFFQPHTCKHLNFFFCGCGSIPQYDSRGNFFTKRCMLNRERNRSEEHTSELQS